MFGLSRSIKEGHIKKIFHVTAIVLAIMVFLSGTTVALLSKPVHAMSGSGTQEDPYIIYDVYDLQAIENDLDAYYELGGDIDASETVEWSGGEGFVPLGGEDGYKSPKPTGDIMSAGTWVLYPDDGVIYTKIQINDGDDSYITAQSNDCILVMSHQPMNLNKSATKIMVRVSFVSKCESDGVSHFRGVVRIGGVNYESGSVSWNDTDYRDVSCGRWYNNPATGLRWTPDEINGVGPNSIEGFGVAVVDATPNVRFTLIRGEVTYDNPFTGHLDGKEFAITNLFMDRPDLVIGKFPHIYSPGGLFRTSAGTITRLTIEDCDITASNAGGMVCRNEGSISNCHVTGTINGRSSAGGFVHEDYYGTISECSSDCQVTAIGAGGFLYSCSISEGTITKCYALGDVSSISSDYGEASGFVVSAGGVIQNCYSRCSAISDVPRGVAGGFVIYNFGSIEDCYSTGIVLGPLYIGGFCMAIGNFGVISDCFWDIETSGTETSGGGTGKTTAEMKTKSTFTDAGWDFTTPIWYIVSSLNDGYPGFEGLAVLSAEFSWSPDEPVVGENITFDASSSTGDIMTYDWDFGDNTTATTGNVTITHSYQNIGVFPVSLTVTSSDNKTASVSKTVSVQPWSFAIITDLHIGWGIPDYGSQGFADNTTGQEYYLTKRLRVAVNWINDNRSNPDYNIKFVVVTGDIADTAEYSEFLTVREILNGLEIPYIPLIGNHDIWPYVAKINYGPDDRPGHEASWANEDEGDPLGDQYFEEVFWGEANSENRAKIEDLFGEGVFVRQEVPYLQNYAFSYGSLHFVALDFVQRTWAHSPPIINEEDLHQKTLDWFQGELDKYDNERVIVFHHHPFISISGPMYVDCFGYDPLNLIKGMIVESNCEVINFAGHLHRNWTQTPANKYAVVETQALQQDPCPVPGYWAGAWATGEFIRIVQVTGTVVEDVGDIGDIEDIEGLNCNILIDEFPPAINPYFLVLVGDACAGLPTWFYPQADNRDITEISQYYWEFGDGDNATVSGPFSPEDWYLTMVEKEYSTAGTYTVSLNVTDIFGDSEEISWNLEVKAQAAMAYNIDFDAVGLTAVLGQVVNIDLTEPAFAQNTAEWVVLLETASPGKPIGALYIHFEQATQDIDLSGIHADIDLEAKKSVLYMPAWPAEVEELKQLYIPYSENGTVYICPNATSLDEVNPHSPGTVFLEPWETVDGMTAVPTIYVGELYYLVYGFTGGGGGVNLPPVADANGPYSSEEGSLITLTASNSTDPNGDPLKHRWDFDNDGSWDTDWLIEPSVEHAWSDDYAGGVIVEVWDGEHADSAATAASISNVAPTIVEITAPLDPVPVSTQIIATANFTDPSTADTHTATWDWGDNATSEGYIDEAAGLVSGNHTYTVAGVYTVKLTVADDDGASDESIFHYVVVYDPSAGFVTGGGWINSPTGAYADDPLLTGKSNFSFVCKYQQGASTPTGQTEFLFKPAGLNFHSTSYEWLVITRAKAILKGEGTINGEGFYKFQTTVIDAEIDPNDGFNVDRFRIKIWEEVGGDEVVIYDNALGDDSDYALTELGGGSIVIHES